MRNFLRLADKLDATQEGGKLSINKANLRNLSEKLTTDKIAEIKAKAISYRRTRIKVKPSAFDAN